MQVQHAQLQVEKPPKYLKAMTHPRTCNSQKLEQESVEFEP